MKITHKMYISLILFNLVTKIFLINTTNFFYDINHQKKTTQNNLKILRVKNERKWL